MHGHFNFWPFTLYYVHLTPFSSHFLLRHLPAWHAILWSLQPHCLFMAPGFRENVCAHSMKYSDGFWHSVGWQSPANVNWQAPWISILLNGSTCLLMMTEIVIFTKPPWLQISCCWQKFTLCIQALIYDLRIIFLHSGQDGTEALLSSDLYLSSHLIEKDTSVLVFSSFCYLVVFSIRNNKYNLVSFPKLIHFINCADWVYVQKESILSMFFCTEILSDWLYFNKAKMKSKYQHFFCLIFHFLNFLEIWERKFFYYCEQSSIYW